MMPRGFSDVSASLHDIIIFTVADDPHSFLVFNTKSTSQLRRYFFLFLDVTDKIVEKDELGRVSIILVFVLGNKFALFIHMEFFSID